MKVLSCTTYLNEKLGEAIVDTMFRSDNERISRALGHVRTALRDFDAKAEERHITCESVRLQLAVLRELTTPSADESQRAKELGTGALVVRVVRLSSEEKTQLARAMLSIHAHLERDRP